MAKCDYCMIYFLDTVFDDLGQKIDNEKIIQMDNSGGCVISDIVKDGGVQIGDIWHPYHQMHKIVCCQKEEW